MVSLKRLEAGKVYSVDALNPPHLLPRRAAAPQPRVQRTSAPVPRSWPPPPIPSSPRRPPRSPAPASPSPPSAPSPSAVAPLSRPSRRRPPRWRPRMPRRRRRPSCGAVASRRASPTPWSASRSRSPTTGSCTSTTSWAARPTRPCSPRRYLMRALHQITCSGRYRGRLGVGLVSYLLSTRLQRQLDVMLAVCLTKLVASLCCIWCDPQLFEISCLI